MKTDAQSVSFHNFGSYITQNTQPVADLGIFRGGGGGFSKKTLKILSTFFQVDQIDFLSYPKPL